MDIERMHRVMERLAESVECEFNKGIECVDMAEMSAAIDMLKDLAEAEYYRKISIAMDEYEYDDYEDGRRGYGARLRDSKGRYMSRKGYEAPMRVHNDEWADVERRRDLDRPYGRMGYTESHMHDSREGRSGISRRGYMEAKEQGKDKQSKMHELENYMKELSEDVTEMIGDASQEEKAMLKSKLNMLMQKF